MAVLLFTKNLGLFVGFLAARTAFLAAAILFVYRGPCDALSFLLRFAALFVAFLYVLGLAFLLIGVGRFISLWHDQTMMR